jgi:WD40 repeat protein
MEAQTFWSFISNTNTWQEMQKLTGYKDDAVTIVFSPNIQWLVASLKDGTAVITDVSTWSTVATLHIYTRSVDVVAFRPDSSCLTKVSDDDGSITIRHRHLAELPDPDCWKQSEFHCLQPRWEVAGGRSWFCLWH